MELSARIRQLAGGLIEPFTSRRHRLYAQQITRLESEVATLQQLQAPAAGRGAIRANLGRCTEMPGAGDGEASAEVSLRAALLQMEARMEELEDRITREQANLGLVAGGLDELRQNAEMFDNIRERLQVYEACLTDIARRVDAVASGEAVVEPLPGKAIQGVR